MTDAGNVHFGYDRSTQTVQVTLRPPFALPSGAVSATMHVSELLELAAKIQLQLIADGRALAARLPAAGLVQSGT